MGWLLRRPLGVFAVVVVVGVVAIALGMKAFAGSSGDSGYSATPLSQAQFARLGQNACVSLGRQLKAATGRKPRNLAAARRSVRRVASILDGVNMELDGRVPPASEVAPFRRFLAHLQSADRAMHRLDRLIETGQLHSAALLVRSRWWHDIGKRLAPSPRPGHAGCSRARHPGAILIAVGARVSGATSAAAYYFAKPLSPAQFVDAVERICVSLRGRLKATIAQKPSNVTEAATLVHNLTSLLDGFLMQLRALNPPPSVAVPFRRVLRAAQADDDALHSLDQLGRLGQWERAARLVRSRWWQHMENRSEPSAGPASIDCG